LGESNYRKYIVFLLRNITIDSSLDLTMPVKLILLRNARSSSTCKLMTHHHLLSTIPLGQLQEVSYVQFISIPYQHHPVGTFKIS